MNGGNLGIAVQMLKVINQQGGSQSWESTCTPSELALTEIAGGIQLDWAEACTDEDGFEIWISIDGTDYVLLDTVAADVITYQDLTDYAGSTVEYKVRAYKGTTYSEYSDEAEITIAANITDLAASWVDDFARITFTGVSGYQTELYESVDDTNWTLVTTLNDGVETYDNYTWQGTTVYFRARTKSGTEYGPYCSSINIATPLVFKVDQDARTNYTTIGPFDLAAGKTVTVDWGDGHTSNYTTTGDPTHNYTSCGAAAADPYYVKLSGDIAFITKLWMASNTIQYGDLSKWILPAALVDLRIYSCAFTGDLSLWQLHSNIRVCYISANAFTGIPRGELKQLEGVTAGLYMQLCACDTAAIDAFLAYANIYFATNTPIQNTIFKLNGATMGIPTGANSNTDRLGIIAKYTAAGFTATIDVRTV